MWMRRRGVLCQRLHSILIQVFERRQRGVLRFESEVTPPSHRYSALQVLKL